MSMRWYAVHILSGSENRAVQALQQRIEANGLQDRFGAVLVPSETTVDPRTKRKLTRRFYPGYMFVQMALDNETWFVVKNTPKVMGFVGGSRTPPPMGEDEVRRITQRMEGIEEVRPVLDFELGEQVRLTDGPYASMNGVVCEIKEAVGKLRVEINIFGRKVSAELGYAQVEKIS